MRANSVGITNGWPSWNIAEVADEPLVEDRVDRGAVVDAALRQTPDLRPLGPGPPSHEESLRSGQDAEGEVEGAAGASQRRPTEKPLLPAAFRWN